LRGEGGDFHAAGGEFFGHFAIVVGFGILIQGGEAQEGDAGFFELFAAGFEGGGGAAFGEVGDEDDGGALGVVDQGLAVGEGLGDVGAAAKLAGEEEFDGVVELVAEVYDGGVEEEEADF